MDPSAVFRGDVFAPISRLLVPGAFALAPYLVLLYDRRPSATRFFNEHELACGLAILLACVAIGLILENLGARIELVCDWLISRRDDGHGEVWNRYLALVLEPEPVGQHYLRTLLVRMKFELSFLASLPIQTVGWSWVASSVLKASPGVVLGVALGGVFLIGWFFYESYTSAVLLGGVRRILVAASAPGARGVAR